MRHLSDAEFVDLIEGELPAARAAHVDGCAACGDRAAALRGTLERARQDEGPEPSPLFWDHFSARVSDAIAQQPPPASAPNWAAWLQNPAVAWAAAASLALLLMVGALWRATNVPASTPAPHAAAGAQSLDGASLLEDMDLNDDAAWAIVRSAADDFVWEDAQAIGIAARPGSAERAVMELSSDERAELARLLEQELKRSGA